MTLHYKLETIKGGEQPVLTGSVGVRNMKADQTGHSAALQSVQSYSAASFTCMR